MVVVFDQPFQILLELVQTHKLDPWDVDIEKLTDIFVRRIREMQKLDLRVSGRTLLSAAILLRMKSSYLASDGHGQDEEEFDDGIDLELPELGPLMMVQRTPRKITLDELMGTLQEALKKPPSQKPKPRRELESIIHELSEYHINIEEMLEEFHRRIAELAPNGETIGLTELLTEKSRLELARTLLLALFLSTQGKITLRQDEPFGEIFISLEERPGA